MGEITLAASENALIARFEPPVSKRSDLFKIILADYPFLETARDETGGVVAIRYEARNAKNDSLSGLDLEEQFRNDHEVVSDYLGYAVAGRLVKIGSGKSE